jgi:hypothetical protein
MGNVTNVMLFFRSKGVATPLLRKNRKKKTLHLQRYRNAATSLELTFLKEMLVLIIACVALP